MQFGILGSGQLAWMLGLAARKAGHTAKFLDPKALAGHEELRSVDFLTFESEFLDYQLWNKALRHVMTYPPPRAMEQLSDKWEQKLLFQRAGLPTAKAELLLPDSPRPTAGVAKWTRQGYDGYGNFFCKQGTDEQWKDFSQKAEKNSARIYLEAEVAFQSEFALVCARDIRGKFMRYPALLTEQKNGVCNWVWGPAGNYFPAIEKKVSELWPNLMSFLENLNYVGVVAFEFFCAQDEILLNEVAPRVHNSAHLTLDAYNLSQFDLHLLAIQGFGDNLLQPQSTFFAMKNCLGTEAFPVEREAFVEESDTKVKTYWYGKKESRPGRKMGHLNYCYERKSREDVKKLLQERESELWQSLKKNPS